MCRDPDIDTSYVAEQVELLCWWCGVKLQYHIGNSPLFPILNLLLVLPWYGILMPHNLIPQLRLPLFCYISLSSFFPFLF